MDKIEDKLIGLKRLIKKALTKEDKGNGKNNETLNEKKQVQDIGTLALETEVDE